MHESRRVLDSYVSDDIAGSPWTVKTKAPHEHIRVTYEYIRVTYEYTRLITVIYILTAMIQDKFLLHSFLMASKYIRFGKVEAMALKLIPKQRRLRYFC